jgi:anti-sigma regulatory factor (Ser/Thr protein kinase)
VRDARYRTAAVLRRWNCPREQVDDIVLVVSEVVTNAVQHGAGVVRLRLLRRRTRVRIEVQDDSPRPPVLLTTAGVTADWGRGLHIVGDLAARWGSRRAGEGKLVWAEVPCGVDLGVDDLTT